ncbi:hypothetical protein AB1L30_11140 [Bremerella sp. JC817]|uniref:hypothetical protein n=1 Tax=Bremerella sp. JC817 TaxID=3231756 RepID=UPI00345B10A9
MLRHVTYLVAIASLATLTLGCQPQRQNATKFPVQGTVTLDEKPMPKGIIYFKTIATGSVDAMDIVDGKFSGEAEPGERRVEISAFRPVPSATPGMGEGEENFIPAKYNAKSTLSADVTTDKQINDFQFAVTSK